MEVDLKDCFHEWEVILLLGVELIVIVFLAIFLHHYRYKSRERSRCSPKKDWHKKTEEGADTSSRKDLSGRQGTPSKDGYQRLEEEVEAKKTAEDDEVKRLKTELQALREEHDIALQVEREEVTRLKAQVQKQNQAFRALEIQNDSLKRQLARESKAKEDALFRLSENMAVQLTDGNPDITDLSDENRPGKLNERLSELYDNQYTAAQEILEANYGRSYSGDKLTEKMAQLLLNILKSAYAVCQESTERQLTRFRHIFTNPVDDADSTLGTELSKVEIDLSKTVMKAFKDMRKIIKPDLSALKKKVFVLVTQDSEPNFAETVDREDVQEYMNECIQTCWLMSVQDPPMYLEFNEQSHDRLRRFTQSGSTLEFYVWPSLYLHKEGPLMAKGVAQFSK